MDTEYLELFPQLQNVVKENTLGGFSYWHNESGMENESGYRIVLSIVRMRVIFCPNRSQTFI